MSSSKNTLWIAGTGVLAVLILVASYFLLIAPKRAAAAETQTAASGVEQSNEALAAETERLKAQFATIDEQRAQLAQIRAELPAESDVPALIRQFTVFSAAAGVTVSNIAPGTLTPYVSAVTTTATSASSDATAAAAATSGISTLPVSVTVDGSFAGTELFVKNLQADMNRYMLVDSVSVVREDSTIKTTVTGSLFVLSDESQGATSGTTSSETTAVAAAASTSTGTVN
jgi:type IV pilus assembly protein PilO